MGKEAQETVWGGALRNEIWGVMTRMDGWLSLEDGIKSGKHGRLAFAAYQVMGSVTGQSVLDLHARYGSLPLRASSITSPQCIQAQESKSKTESKNMLLD